MTLSHISGVEGRMPLKHADSTLYMDGGERIRNLIQNKKTCFTACYSSPVWTGWRYSSVAVPMIKIRMNSDARYGNDFWSRKSRSGAWTLVDEKEQLARILEVAQAHKDRFLEKKAGLDSSAVRLPPLVRDQRSSSKDSLQSKGRHYPYSPTMVLWKPLCIMLLCIGRGMH